MMTSLRVVRTGLRSRRLIRTAEDACRVLQPLAHGLDREHFWRLDLDARDRLIACELVSIGSLDTSIAHPREVFKGALLNNACSVVVAHNHPSQDPRPSRADRQVTMQLLLAGHLLQVDLADHIILTDREHYSFKESGCLARRGL
ncbi:MAG: DNA repair protein RadC [Elusimicrobia bacterium]|nr:DNA repair protein RadC [Elusimicrobiota bacterium]